MRPIRFRNAPSAFGGFFNPLKRSKREVLLS